jgi:hypothetical protein
MRLRPRFQEWEQTRITLNLIGFYLEIVDKRENQVSKT